MSQTLNRERLEYAFEGRPDLIGAIQQAAAAPNWIELFNEIALHVAGLRSSIPALPASKKRKIDETTLPINTAPRGANGAAHGNGGSVASGGDAPVLLDIRDISLVAPQRKKYNLEFTASDIRARLPGDREAISNICYAWKDITYAFCLPVPEKTQKQYNYILFPRGSNLPVSQGSPNIEPLVFTIPSTGPKPGTISGIDASTASAVSDSYKSLFDWALARAFTGAGNDVKIVEANEKHFASVIKEAHRPSEKAVFVKGFRGSKDGYLFFLSSGILWGFKKPLLFLPKERIAAVSYTSVLQRTFNLNVEVYARSGKPTLGDGDGEDEEKEEFEFAMLDQEDFAGIDTYIKRHGLQDSSMAEQRRAKRLGINVVKGEDGEKVDVGDTGDLARAAAEIPDGEDEDDEEEEDYDPGSEGESEGEGISSEDDDDDDDGNAKDDDEADEDDDEEEEES